MILLDPDLDPDPTPKSNSAKPPAGSASAFAFRNSRLPSVRALSRFLAEAQAAVHLRGQVTVLLTTDAALRDLNRRFRGKNKPTDVLSFPAANLIQSAKPAERDIAISVETARRQGTACGHPLGTELKILILHGLVHLAGYDHESDTGRMHRREQILRQRLGLPFGLIERNQTECKSHPKIRPIAGGATRGSRRDAGKLAPDGVRRGTRRTQFGESNAKSGKPRRGGASSSSRATRSARP